LNRLLTRLVLRERGSSAYDTSEGELYLTMRTFFARRAGKDEEDLQELCFKLLLRWRSGRLTGFSWKYVDWVLADVRHRKRPFVSLDPEAPIPARHLGPADQADLRERAARFRGSLQEKERRLFDLWIQGGHWGWKGQAAAELQEAASWVTKRLAEFERRLAAEFEIANAEAFVQALRLFQADDEDVPQGPAQLDEEVPPSTQPQADDGRAEILRERLWQRFDEGSLERRFLDDAASGMSAEEIRQRYPREEEILDRLHQEYVSLGQQFQAENEPSPEP
jgi:hypothetical protein